MVEEPHYFEEAEEKIRRCSSRITVEVLANSWIFLDLEADHAGTDTEDHEQIF